VIDRVLETPTTEARRLWHPLFMVNSPAVNPFVMPGPVTFVKSDDILISSGRMSETARRAGRPTDLAQEFVTRPCGKSNATPTAQGR